MREREFQSKVVQYARLTGWKVYHTYDSRRSNPGFPDLVLVKNRVVYAELKTETGKLSEAQKAWRDALVKAGAEFYVWKPSDMKEIGKVLSS